MLNQRKQAERRSLEAAQLSLLGKTIETQGERIKALESLLARCAVELPIWQQYYDDNSEYHRDGETYTTHLIAEIDAILPKTEEVKDE